MNNDRKAHQARAQQGIDSIIRDARCLLDLAAEDTDHELMTVAQGALLKSIERHLGEPILWLYCGRDPFTRSVPDAKAYPQLARRVAALCDIGRGLLLTPDPIAVASGIECKQSRLIHLGFVYSHDPMSVLRSKVAWRAAAEVIADLLDEWSAENPSELQLGGAPNEKIAFQLALDLFRASFSSELTERFEYAGAALPMMRSDGSEIPSHEAYNAERTWWMQLTELADSGEASVAPKKSDIEPEPTHRALLRGFANPDPNSKKQPDRALIRLIESESGSVSADELGESKISTARLGPIRVRNVREAIVARWPDLRHLIRTEIDTASDSGRVFFLASEASEVQPPAD